MNCDTPNPCDNLECCAEIVNSKCVKHDGVQLDTLLALVTEVYDAQNIGGLNNSDLPTAVNALISGLTPFISATYDLSGVTVGGSGGGTTLTTQQAIQHLINHITNP